MLAEAERYDSGEKLKKVMQSIADKRDLTAQDLDALYRLALDIHTHVNNQQDVDKNNIPLEAAIKFYEYSMAYAFSFLLGHEAFHFNGNQCHIKQDSIIKAKSVWPVIVGLQQKKGLFDKVNRIELNELKADHCGYKWLERVSKDSNKNKEDKVFNAMSKQMAVDLLASPLIIGLKGKIGINEMGDDAPHVKVLGGYLYPQSRLALVSATLRLTENNYPNLTKICNAAAKAMVSMIQTSVVEYPDSSGEVPDELLAELPPGVEEAWNGQPWSEDSYACVAGGVK